MIWHSKTSASHKLFVDDTVLVDESREGVNYEFHLHIVRLWNWSKVELW